MNVPRILDYLHTLSANNNKEWFTAHRAEYDVVQADFQAIAETLIQRIAAFDPSIAGIPVKSVLYRFYRDLRFSQDKSPYKNHFGCYINAHGKKSIHGGYYFHLEPGNCLLAGGSYCLPTQVLTAVRWDIVNRLDRFRAIVEAPTFKKLFPTIGESALKTLPKGFDADFPYPEYLRPKDYSVLHRLDASFFERRDWIDETVERFRAMRPFLDFINETVDDYI